MAYGQYTEEAIWQKNLRGWGGIAVKREGNDSKLTKDICSDVASSVEYLAAVAKIPFVYTGRSSAGMHVVKIVKARLKNTIDLIIAVTHTTGSGLTSVYGSVSASDFYVNAIDANAEKNELGYLPRSATLEFYRNGVVGHGPRSTIGSVIANNLKKHTQEFMTLYVKHHQPMP